MNSHYNYEPQRTTIESLKLLTVVGARPQFIKAAPVSRALEAHNAEHPDRPLHEILLHTGQHYDDAMSKVFFEELELPEPAYNLGVGSGTHARQTGQMLERIEATLLKEQPDLVLVYGDTNSTLAGALAAAKLHVPLAHVEAGLRSYNKKMPEEINRVLADHISDLLFCPTQTAVNNLKAEGIEEGVYNVGDVMYDAVLCSSRIAEQRSSILAKLELHDKAYALATVHRAENTDDPERIRAIWAAFRAITELGVKVVLPLHPRVSKRWPALAKGQGGLVVTKPVAYLDMLMLERHAKMILTDSGGVQKEAYFFQVPCITLRDETEWIETVASGWNRLVGADCERILAAVETIEPAARTRGRTDLFGGGNASHKIIALLGRYLSERRGHE